MSDHPPYTVMVVGLGTECLKILDAVIRRKAIRVPLDIKADRLVECQECENYMNDKKCKLCGCSLRRKTSLAISKCPIDKWKEWNPDDSLVTRVSTL